MKSSRLAPKGTVLKGVLAAAGAVFLLSGCGYSGVSRAMVIGESCLSDRADIIADADWDTAIVRDMKIIDGNYRPMVMQLEKDRAYVLRVRNVDPIDHNMWAPGLLKQGVAFDSVQIGDKTPAKGCVNGVRVAARTTVTIKFVPVWEGRYELNNGLLPVAPTGLADGVFHIVEQRIGVASN